MITTQLSRTAPLTDRDPAPLAHRPVIEPDVPHRLLRLGR